MPTCLRTQLVKYTCISFLTFTLLACSHDKQEKEITLLNEPVSLSTHSPFITYIDPQSTTPYKLEITLDTAEEYGRISVHANGKLIADRLNIASSGTQTLNTLILLPNEKTEFKISASNSNITILEATLTETPDIHLPRFTDISRSAGLDKVSSIKYGGPTIADIDQDGDYDFILNNHNAESSKLYWNNGDRTASKHHKNLSRWFMHDLHGTAAGDYDSDGDLDIVVTQGGGNGTNPSKANFYKNENSTLVRFTGDVGIDRGGRGRGARWIDMDLDGDLDLLLFNEESLTKTKPQHFFYENKGNGTFNYRSVAGVQDVHQSRVLVTDLNGDHIDDIVFYGPLSIWLGNGDFTYKEDTENALKHVPEYTGIMAVADIDIDNDGDLDLYLARGQTFEYGIGEPAWLDHSPQTKTMSIKSRGFKGVDQFDFTASGDIKLDDYYYLAQGLFRGKVYPIFLGTEKSRYDVLSKEDFSFNAAQAEGWPTDISENGLYFGHLGNNRWRAALVRNQQIFWAYKFRLNGVTDVEPEFTPHNRNVADILLRNDNGVFNDVSDSWNIPKGVNSLGVTIGDFNNDSYQDLFVYRWGLITGRISDYLLLNNAGKHFETVTMHGANDIGGPGNGDMGQAFDFDSDGKVDLINGSEGGEWYLFANTESNENNHLSIRVGYSPQENVDPISAEVTVHTKNKIYKRRVGSRGEVFSQSLLNIVHFGLGNQNHVNKVSVRWRNGETLTFNNKPANILLDTNFVDPTSLVISPSISTARENAQVPMSVSFTPDNANRQTEWSSSDNNVLSVDQNGIVLSKGKVGESAVITAKSLANGLSSSQTLTIVPWTENPVTALSLNAPNKTLIQGESIAVNALIDPIDADNPILKWSSSDENVAKVDNNGVVTALNRGDTHIRATVNSAPSLFQEVNISVEDKVEPYLNIINKHALTLRAGEKIDIQAQFHAGSKHQVIFSDEGGVRFWLRHFRSKWVPVKDRVVVDSSALNNRSGTASAEFSLLDVTPSKDLPEGHFYSLRATFTSSDGNMYSDEIYPITILEEEE